MNIQQTGSYKSGQEFIVKTIMHTPAASTFHFIVKSRILSQFSTWNPTDLSDLQKKVKHVLPETLDKIVSLLIKMKIIYEEKNIYYLTEDGDKINDATEGGGVDTKINAHWQDLINLKDLVKKNAHHTVEEMTLPDQIYKLNTLGEFIISPLILSILYTSVSINLPKKIQRGTRLTASEMILARVLGRFNFCDNSDGTWVLTEQGKILLPNDPHSLHHLIKLEGPDRLKTYYNMNVLFEKGTIPFEHVHKRSFFKFLQNHSEIRTNFNKAMEEISEMEAEWLAEFKGFSATHEFVDIGEGNGRALAALLKKYPITRGILFDQSTTPSQTSPSLDSLKKRYQTVNGSLFIPSDIPKTNGIYILKRVLHNWDDKKTLQILQNICNAMEPGAKVWIIEPIKDTVPNLTLGDCSDFYLMAIGGKERSVKDYDALLKDVGLKRESVRHFGGYLFGIEASKIVK